MVAVIFQQDHHCHVSALSWLQGHHMCANLLVLYSFTLLQSDWIYPMCSHSQETPGVGSPYIYVVEIHTTSSKASLTLWTIWSYNLSIYKVKDFLSGTCNCVWQRPPINLHKAGDSTVDNGSMSSIAYFRKVNYEFLLMEHCCLQRCTVSLTDLLQNADYYWLSSFSPFHLLVALLLKLKPCFCELWQDVFWNLKLYFMQ